MLCANMRSLRKADADLGKADSAVVAFFVLQTTEALCELRRQPQVFCWALSFKLKRIKSTPYANRHLTAGRALSI